MEKQQNFQTSLESKYFNSEKAISNIWISNVPEESDAFKEFMLKINKQSRYINVTVSNFAIPIKNYRRNISI